nr:MAG TPA: hypothetical protein [Caudoviricetes sp.]
MYTVICATLLCTKCFYLCYTIARGEKDGE